MLRPDRRYGMLLLISDNRGMVLGFEDLITNQPFSDRDFNDLIVSVSSSVLLTG